MIEVHHFKILDASTGEWIIPHYKCTAERIAKLKGKIVKGTMNVVSRTSLDKESCYHPETVANKPT